MGDPSRTTAMGLWTDADEMLTAARILIESGEHRVLDPTYYLLGHAIEVALKSYLLAKGKSLDHLRNKIGHDISKAAQKVVAMDGGDISNLINRYQPHIDMLNQYYKAKEFEYRVTGLKHYPTTSDLANLLDSLLPMLVPVVDPDAPNV